MFAESHEFRGTVWIPSSWTEAYNELRYDAVVLKFDIAPSLGARFARSSPCGGNPAPELSRMSHSGLAGLFEFSYWILRKGPLSSAKLLVFNT